MRGELARAGIARLEPDPHRAPCRSGVLRIRSDHGARQLFRIERHESRAHRAGHASRNGLRERSFAASLAAVGSGRYTLEYIGKLALAKGYGESPIYRLARR